MKKITGLAAALLVTGLFSGTAVFAQPTGTPKTSNPVPVDCARLTDQRAKDECARAQNKGSSQGTTQGTGVGKGQGQGAGTGQGKGQGAVQGTGQGKKN